MWTNLEFTIVELETGKWIGSSIVMRSKPINTGYYNFSPSLRKQYCAAHNIYFDNQKTWCCVTCKT